MAGIRQHILPRFLLKEFASRVNGEKVFTRVYRKGDSSFETTIENISVERHFYGRADDLSADEEITSLEGNYANLVSELRNKPQGIQIYDDRIPEFIAHLAVRTKHIRQFFRESSEYLIEQVTEYLTDFENLKTLITRNPKLVRDEFDKVFGNLPIDPFQKKVLWSLVESNLPLFLDQKRGEFEDLARTFMAEMATVLPKAVVDGHIKALAKNPVPQPRVEEYSKLNWFVAQTSAPLVLGDAGCVFEIGRPNRFKPMDDKFDDILGIFLPIASFRLLAGLKEAGTVTPKVTLLNEASAKCSREYFVSAEESPSLVKMAESIGVWSEVVTKEELRDLINEIHSTRDGLQRSANN